MQFGFPSDLSLYKLLTDWGSLIGGVFALIAGLIAYIVGLQQARATREAAATQIDAERRRYEQGVDALGKSLALELRQMVLRALAAHHSLAALVTQLPPPITSRMIESSAILPVPLVYPAVADRIALLGDNAIDAIIVYQMIDLACAGTAQLARYRTPDDVSRVAVAAAANTFLQACLYAKAVLPKIPTGIDGHELTDRDVIWQIDKAAAAWKATAGAEFKL